MDSVLAYFLGTSDVHFVINPTIVFTWIMLYLVANGVKNVNKSVENMSKVIGEIKGEVIAAKTELVHVIAAQREMHADNIRNFGRPRF
jgi:hypothetical protein